VARPETSLTHRFVSDLEMELDNSAASTCCCLAQLLLPGFGEDGTPNIRPLETLHNALSLRQVDGFLEQITAANYKTPTLSPKMESPSPQPFRDDVTLNCDNHNEMTF